MIWGFEDEVNPPALTDLSISAKSFSEIVRALPSISW